MEVTGKIIQKLPLVSGTSKAGTQWSKQEYVLETNDNFPRKVFFDFFGERANQYNLEVGDEVVLSFDIESREYNGRWYTNIRGWKAEKKDPNAPQPVAASQPEFGAVPAGPAPTGPIPAAPAPIAGEPLPDFTQPSGDDDLPF